MPIVLPRLQWQEAVVVWHVLQSLCTGENTLASDFAPQWRDHISSMAAWSVPLHPSFMFGWQSDKWPGAQLLQSFPASTTLPSCLQQLIGQWATVWLHLHELDTANFGISAVVQLVGLSGPLIVKTLNPAETCTCAVEWPARIL